MTYDDDAIVHSKLCDYHSKWFSVGHTEGFEGRRRLSNRPPSLSDIEWASYCEGWLMGHCEGVMGDEEQNAKWYVEVTAGHWQIRDEKLKEDETPSAHFARLKAALTS